MTARFWAIDFARGLAVIGMIIFHALWQLNYFSYTTLSLYSGWLGLFQKTIAITFLLLAGIGLTLSANRRDDYNSWFVKRGLFIFGLGMLITTFTFLFFREGLIFFGVLHLIGASIILGIAFGNVLYKNGKRIRELNNYDNVISKLGKYSLLIYFIHQPILFGLLMLLPYIK